ncbi:uncharacterized protein LOC143277682 [Babylonia areolata]|uniref:uncharacterized protein LOC143277682 n=1 Tax=Babylonia areolata TaxID=304850 RepID=UPI003FD2A7EA
MIVIPVPLTRLFNRMNRHDCHPRVVNQSLQQFNRLFKKHKKTSLHFWQQQAYVVPHGKKWRRRGLPRGLGVGGARGDEEEKQVGGSGVPVSRTAPAPAPAPAPCPSQCRLVVWRVSVLLCRHSETVHLQQLTRCVRSLPRPTMVDLRFSSPKFCNCTLWNWLWKMSTPSVWTVFPPVCSRLLISNCGHGKIWPYQGQRAHSGGGLAGEVPLRNPPHGVPVHHMYRVWSTIHGHFTKRNAETGLTNRLLRDITEVLTRRKRETATDVKRSVDPNGPKGNRNIRSHKDAEDMDIVITKTDHGMDIDAVEHPNKKKGKGDEHHIIHMDKHGSPKVAANHQPAPHHKPTHPHEKELDEHEHKQEHEHEHEHKQEHEHEHVHLHQGEKAKLHEEGGKEMDVTIDAEYAPAAELEELLFALGGALCVIFMFCCYLLLCRPKDGEGKRRQSSPGISGWFSGGRSGEDSEKLIGNENEPQYEYKEGPRFSIASEAEDNDKKKKKDKSKKQSKRKGSTSKKKKGRKKSASKQGKNSNAGYPSDTSNNSLPLSEESAAASQDWDIQDLNRTNSCSDSLTDLAVDGPNSLSYHSSARSELAPLPRRCPPRPSPHLPFTPKPPPPLPPLFLPPPITHSRTDTTRRQFSSSGKCQKQQRGHHRDHHGVCQNSNKGVLPDGFSAHRGERVQSPGFSGVSASSRGEGRRWSGHEEVKVSGDPGGRGLNFGRRAGGEGQQGRRGKRQHVDEEEEEGVAKVRGQRSLGSVVVAMAEQCAAMEDDRHRSRTRSSPSSSQHSRQSAGHRP